MTEKEFLRAVANDKPDLIQLLLNVLSEARANYCVIGGLAVNAYTEPVVRLDLGIVIAADEIERICKAAARVFRIKRFPNSINLSAPGSDLRIQIQTDPRYQDFPERAIVRNVLGYSMKVAAPEDVLRGKVWAWSDEQRRRSKRQKDLADILRLVEAQPALAELLPPDLRKQAIEP
jgi:hypothetical protein